MKEQGGAIRLTNRTAIALRRYGEKVKTVCIVFGITVTIIFSAMAVYFGIRWLPAVPVFVVSAVLIDVLLYMHAEKVRLSTMAQAVCMEEAVRSLREESTQRARKKQAEEDRREAMEDALSAAVNAENPPSSVVRIHREGNEVRPSVVHMDLVRKKEDAVSEETDQTDEPDMMDRTEETPVPETHRRRRGQPGPEGRRA